MKLIQIHKFDSTIHAYITIRYIKGKLEIYLAKTPVKAYIIKFKPFSIKRNEWSEGF